MTVLLTGSSGRIGRMLTARLPPRGIALRTFDRVPPADVVADVTDLAALTQAMAGVDAVVHLAGQPTEAPWPVIRAANIDGTVTLFEAARAAGVRRVVYASSNHAVGFTPHDDLSAGADLPADTPARPDTLYGVSKVFGEALGRYYVDRYGFDVACLRIGSCQEEPPNSRALATWLSPGDVTALVSACLTHPHLGYRLIWGVSANRHRWFSLDAGAEIGFVPEDDAAAVRPELDVADRGALDARVGGEYTEAEFGIDEVTAGFEHDSTGTGTGTGTTA
ncbi:NAD(P)-dependent oxidoreductase [Jatrophihabitans telluris]|uniref:NAD(P)-dependent oxidoreductase n=1 Tax=Jatrophihabitans telluris TaxID=2038343 RepID=A0ABY4QW01_9ACTN|nr:NAD(P)-dependent oxidoreductase [Jatrophihabitans telluris]UQX87799.1 NAD(P)-dependent oxidoreductase [Jatrophihabitans telluris]